MNKTLRFQVDEVSATNAYILPLLIALGASATFLAAYLGWSQMW